MNSNEARRAKSEAENNALVGKPFGRLTVKFWSREGPHYFFHCECACGAKKRLRKNHVVGGRTTSCGCFNREVTLARSRTHGKSRTPTYASWGQVVQRCTNRKAPAWDDYGGRGITVCPRWLGRGGFANFLADMGQRPEGTEIDRKENSKGYSPENCRWATSKENNNNRRSNRLLTHNGKTQTVSQWADETGIAAGRICQRIDRLGWPVDKALSASPPKLPPGGHNRRKTHCPAGHEYTPENTYRSGNSRTCKTCHRLKEQQRSKSDVHKS